MQGFTYSELEQAMKDWPENTDDVADGYVDNIPRLTQLGELRVVKDLNLEIFDLLDTSGVLNINNRLVTKPAELIVTRSMWTVIAGVRTPVIQRSRDFVINYSLDTAATATPKYYAEYSEFQWIVGKVPAASGTIETIGVYRPASLFDEETTWLGDHCGDLIFSASLMESEHFVKADDRYDDMKKKYYEELLPVARLELRNLVRAGDYAPYRGAATKVG